MSGARFDRQILMFGEEGQARIGATRVALVGTGGTGSHVAQQLAYLGVRSFDLIDRDLVETTNLNRLIGACPTDAEQERRKVDVAADHIERIASGAVVRRIGESVISEAGYAALRNADVVIGCVDRDAVRLILNEVCLAYAKPLLDLATDVPAGAVWQFGGRVFFSANAPSTPPGCIACLDLLDAEAARRDFMSEAQRQEETRIYGVPRTALAATGPSVVSLNGVIASLAVTEFIAHVTSLRAPQRLLVYKGEWGVVNRSDDQPPECPVCGPTGNRGRAADADTEHWIREGWGNRL